MNDNPARWNIAGASIRRNCGSAKFLSIRATSQAFHMISLVSPGCWIPDHKDYGIWGMRFIRRRQ